MLRGPKLYGRGQSVQRTRLMVMRLRPKFWPWGQSGLNVLTSLFIITIAKNR